MLGGADEYDRTAALDDGLRTLVARHYASASPMELPSAVPSRHEEWEPMLAAAALSCAGLTAFLKERIDAFFVDAFDALLAASWPTAADVSAVEWPEAEAVMRRHQVTGGLSPQQREQLFDAYRERLVRAEGPRESSSSA
mgnify:CR=1 FL=1